MSLLQMLLRPDHDEHPERAKVVPAVQPWTEARPPRMSQLAFPSLDPLGAPGMIGAASAPVAELVDVTRPHEVVHRL